MEAFKIENYERDHGAGTFVPFRHLSQDEAKYIFQLPKLKLKLPEEVGALRVLSVIMDKSVIVKDADATKDSFSLRRLLSQLNLDNADNLHLNWHRFDNIDEIRTDDLCNMFSDIWYPSSVDLHIFNSNCDWILSVEHHGAISFLRFAKSTKSERPN